MTRAAPRTWTVRIHDLDAKDVESAVPMARRRSSHGRASGRGGRLPAREAPPGTTTKRWCRRSSTRHRIGSSRNAGSTSVAADAACSICPTMRSCATRSAPCSRPLPRPSASPRGKSCLTGRLALEVSPQGPARRALRPRPVRGAGRVSRAGSQPGRGHHRLRGARGPHRFAGDAVARVGGVARSQSEDSADRDRGGGRLGGPRHSPSGYALGGRPRCDRGVRGRARSRDPAAARSDGHRPAVRGSEPGVALSARRRRDSPLVLSARLRPGQCRGEPRARAAGGVDARSRPGGRPCSMPTAGSATSACRSRPAGPSSRGWSSVPRWSSVRVPTRRTTRWPHRSIARTSATTRRCRTGCAADGTSCSSTRREPGPRSSSNTSSRPGRHGSCTSRATRTRWLATAARLVNEKGYRPDPHRACGHVPAHQPHRIGDGIRAVRTRRSDAAISGNDGSGNATVTTSPRVFAVIPGTTGRVPWERGRPARPGRRPANERAPPQAHDCRCGRDARAPGDTSRTDPARLQRRRRLGACGFSVHRHGRDSLR